MHPHLACVAFRLVIVRTVVRPPKGRSEGKDLGRFAAETTLFNCRGRGFELCFSNLRSILNHTVEDEEDETVDNKGKT